MKYYLNLHFIVLLFGFTGILGKLIPLNASELVCYRMLFAAITLFCFLLFSKKSFSFPKTLLPLLFINGIIVALHWVCFFGAIKVANVSVALGCLAAGTLFTSLLEPLFLKKKIFWLEVLIGILVLVGLYVITQFAFNYIYGIILALLAAFLGSLFGLINAKLTHQVNPALIAFYEMFVGFLFIGFYNFIFNNFQLSITHLELSNLFYLLCLSVICTAYAFVGIIKLAKHLSMFNISLAINLEPVYGIILAWFIFGSSELMTFGFYIGMLILLSSVFLYPFLKKRYFN